MARTQLPHRIRQPAQNPKNNPSLHVVVKNISKRLRSSRTCCRLDFPYFPESDNRESDNQFFELDEIAAGKDKWWKQYYLVYSSLSWRIQ